MVFYQRGNKDICKLKDRREAPVICFCSLSDELSSERKAATLVFFLRFPKGHCGVAKRLRI